MPESNWACPICQAAHLQTITYVEDIVLTHIKEHYGEGGSNATAQLCSDGEWRVFRDGDGGRWVNRVGTPEMERQWFNVVDGTEVEAPVPDPEQVEGERPLKLEDFAAALEDRDLPEDERITDEAWRLVMGDRQSSYNHPASDFEATGRMWGAILTNWARTEGIIGEDDDALPDIPPRIVALMIGMVKVSRESHKHKHDNLVDLIGYALCADRIERGY